MAMTLHCDIVSAEEAIFSGLAEMVVAHGTLGDLGIEYGHAPLLTSLAPGPVRVKTQNGDEQIYYVSGGFLEVQPGTVTVLASPSLAGLFTGQVSVSQSAGAFKAVIRAYADVPLADSVEDRGGTDYVVVPSCGEESTMQSHIQRSTEILTRLKCRSLVVQQLHREKPRADEAGLEFLRL